MNYKQKLNKDKSILLWIISFIFVVIGIFIRFKGLGTWNLALDEYYIIKSAENILKFGLPQFPNGGYYTRGILMQYLIAPLLAVGIKAEFAGRIIPLLSNLAALPAIYLIAKKIGNKYVALSAVMIFSLSIWEIEYARFARMYAPFQTAFLWYIWLAIKDFEKRSFDYYHWLLILSFMTIFVYEGSLFLAVFNFVPFIILKKFRLKFFVWAVLIFIFSLFANTFDFRTINSSPIYAAEVINYFAQLKSPPPIKLPNILLPYAFHNALSIMLTFVLVFINILMVKLSINSLPIKNFWSVTSILLIILLAFLNQFGLMFLLFLIFYFWNLLEINISNKKIVLYLTLTLIVNMSFWYLFGILSKSWYPLFDDFSSFTIWGVTKRLLIGFFAFPDNYLSLLNYFRTIPLLTIFSAVMLVLLFLLIFIQRGGSSIIKFIFGSIIFLALFATLPTLLYQETRYTFFFIPLVMILVLTTVKVSVETIFKRELIITLLPIGIILTVFFLSKDFNLYHLLNIDKQIVNNRMIYDSNFKVHLYRRYDIKTPTDFVKTHMEKNDLIMINENSLEYYLPKVDYFNFDYKHHAFSILTVEKGEKERWSNAKLIYKNDSLINFIENREETIWYLIFPEGWLTEVDFYDRYREYLIYKGVDGLVKVYKFPKPIK